MIVWSGLGFLVGVIGFGSLILTELVSEEITGDERYYQDHGWVILIGMWFAAAMTQILHRWLVTRDGRVVIDKETGEEFILAGTHSFFFIPTKWWPPLYVLAGLGFAIADHV